MLFRLGVGCCGFGNQIFDLCGYVVQMRDENICLELVLLAALGLVSCCSLIWGSLLGWWSMQRPTHGVTLGGVSSKVPLGLW